MSSLQLCYVLSIFTYFFVIISNADDTFIDYHNGIKLEDIDSNNEIYDNRISNISPNDRVFLSMLNDRKKLKFLGITPIEYTLPLRTQWMKDINDSVSLGELSIPGTHDTMSFYGGIIVQTQVIRLYEQLSGGIRVLDIRCRHIYNRFDIYHDFVYQRANFNDVLQIAVQYLTNYPTEVILMRVKREYKDLGNNRTFSSTFESYRNQSFCRDYIWRDNHIPTLGEVRGKIVILDNFSGSGTYGPEWNGLNIQDDYNVPSPFDINAKWEKVQNHLIATNQGIDGTNIFINFLSGASLTAFPRIVALGVPFIPGINIRTYNYLSAHESDIKNIGILMMDFPIRNLLDQIIKRNENFKF